MDTKAYNFILSKKNLYTTREKEKSTQNKLQTRTKRVVVNETTKELKRRKRSLGFAARAVAPITRVRRSARVAVSSHSSFPASSCWKA